MSARGRRGAVAIAAAVLGSYLVATAPTAAHAEASLTVQGQPTACYNNFGPAKPGGERLDLSDENSRLAVDGDLSTRTSYVGTGYLQPGYMHSWCKVDLGASYAIERVAVRATSGEGTTSFNHAVYLLQERGNFINDPSDLRYGVHESVAAGWSFDRSRMHSVRFVEVGIEWVGNASGTLSTNWGMAEIEVAGVMPDAVDFLPTDTDEVTTPEELTPAAAIAMGVLNGVVGPATPVSEATETQLDAIGSLTASIIDRLPQAEINAVGAAATAQWDALEATVAEPTDQQYYNVIAPTVRPYSNLRIPNPFGSYESNVPSPAREETIACGRALFDCARARSAEPDARFETIRRYNRNGNGDVSDAFRHCYWQALTTKRANAKFAAEIGKAHEDAGTRGGTNPASSRRMDEHNNVIGRDIGKQGGRDSTLSSTCQSRRVLGHKLAKNEYPSGPNLVWLV